MNCYYVTVVDCLKVAPLKIQHDSNVAVNFSNSTCFAHFRALTVNLQKILYNSQVSVGGRQYTIILFINIIFLPIILIYLNDKRRGAIIFCRILAPPQCPPPTPDVTILIYRNDRERGHHMNFSASPTPPPHTPQTPQYLFILMTERGRHYLL